MAFLRLFFFLFLSPLTYATQNCPISRCSSNGFHIKFPFTLQSPKSQNCGYPGFELSCDNQSNSVTLNLPFWGKFFVRNINYKTQQIYLYDPYNCLPRRLLNFSLLGSPFYSVYYQNYTFLSCPSEFMKSSVNPIRCLSNSTHNIIATNSLFLAPLMPPCEKVVTLEVPTSSSFRYLPFSLFSDDIELTWDVPECRVCEAKGGLCGFKNNVNQEITCSKRGGIKDLKVFKIIALSITIPAIACIICIALSRCFRERVQQEIRFNSPHLVSIELAISSRTNLDYELPTPTDVAAESYRKLVLSESRRVPGPNSNTCPICLSEYSPRETLRFIPECNHCFHVECIDKWLGSNSSCPVCRNSPSSVLFNPYLF